MKKKLHRLLYVLLVLTLVISGGFLLYKQIEARAAAQDYEGALQAAGIEDLAAPPAPSTRPSPAPAPGGSGSDQEAEVQEEGDPWLETLRAVDLPALRGVNSDILGWITIPDTELSYPILAGRDNQYYLNHTWSGERNAAGAIFLEMNCASDFSDFNVILYGHRMHNNMMFGTLRFYDNLEYWKEHPRVYLFTDDSVRVYDIFAAMETPVDSPTYSFGLTEETDKQAFIDYAVEASVLDTGIVPTTEDSILTLSTCTQQGGPQSRWVVQAVLRD